MLHDGDPAHGADSLDPASISAGSGGPNRKFLSVWYRCCHVYGRMYRDAEQTAYHGRCPRCGAPVHAPIGPDGTDQRMFMAE